MLDVVCMGSSTIDLFVNVNKSMKQIHPGDKTLVSNLDYETGGGGTNGAVSLARLGCKVAYLGKVGDDHNGERILKELKKENVKVIKTKLSKLRTSFSVLLETKEKDRTIFTFKGANNDLSLDDFKLKKVRAKWLYMTTHLNKSFKTCKEVARYVKKRNTKILFNPSQYLAKQKSKISPILKLTDIIVLNKGIGIHYSGDNSRLLSDIKNIKFMSISDSILDLYKHYEHNISMIDKHEIEEDKFLSYAKKLKEEYFNEST